MLTRAQSKIEKEQQTEQQQPVSDAAKATEGAILRATITVGIMKRMSPKQQVHFHALFLNPAISEPTTPSDINHMMRVHGNELVINAKGLHDEMALWRMSPRPGSSSSLTAARGALRLLLLSACELNEQAMALSPDAFEGACVDFRIARNLCLRLLQEYFFPANMETRFGQPFDPASPGRNHFECLLLHMGCTEVMQFPGRPWAVAAATESMLSLLDSVRSQRPDWCGLRWLRVVMSDVLHGRKASFCLDQEWEPEPDVIRAERVRQQEAAAAAVVHSRMLAAAVGAVGLSHRRSTATAAATAAEVAQGYRVSTLDLRPGATALLRLLVMYCAKALVMDGMVVAV